MSIEQLGRFFEEVIATPELKAEINAIAFEQLPDRLVEYGRARGYDFTADEVREMATAGPNELRPEELDAVQGGICTVSGCVATCLASANHGGPGDIIRNLHEQKVIDISSYSATTSKLTRG